MNQQFIPYLRAFFVVALCVGVSAFFRSKLDPLNIVMIFLFGLTLSAAISGPVPTVISSAVGIAILDYFFIPPYGTLYVYENKYIAAFGTLFLVCVVITTQAERLRRQIRQVQKKEREASALYEMAEELSSSRGHRQIAEVACDHIGKAFSGGAVIFVSDDGKLKIVSEGKTLVDQKELSVVEWAFQHREIAGFGTKTLPAAKVLCLPLMAGQKTLGTLAVTPVGNKSFTFETLTSLQSFASVVASSLERANITETAEKHKIEAESEHSRNLLLSSISHDLRTPLATIIGASENLVHSTNPHEAKDAAKSINQEAERLARIINNVLQAVRLESGSLALKKQPYFIDELIGSALQRAKSILGNRPVNIQLQKNMPLVEIDALLIEQLLVNLLENASKYTLPDSPITIRGSFSKTDLTISIKDSGPGIPEGQAEKIFEKFYREGSDDSPAGTGLGLAICKAIIDAHDGVVRAENSSEGGAVFIFTLPISVTNITDHE